MYYILFMINECAKVVIFLNTANFCVLNLHNTGFLVTFALTKL